MAETKLTHTKIPDTTGKSKKKLGLLTKGNRKMVTIRMRHAYINLLNEVTARMKTILYSKVSKSDVMEMALVALNSLDKEELEKLKDECLLKSD